MLKVVSKEVICSFCWEHLLSHYLLHRRLICFMGEGWHMSKSFTLPQLLFLSDLTDQTDLFCQYTTPTLRICGSYFNLQNINFSVDTNKKIAYFFGIKSYASWYILNNYWISHTCLAKNIVSSLESWTTEPAGSSPGCHLKRKISPCTGLKNKIYRKNVTSTDEKY